MDFCPKCEKLLVPERREDKVLLICKACGFSKELSSAYSIPTRIEGSKRRKTTVIEKPMEVVRRKEEERELMEDYYKVFLEIFAEEEEGEERG